MSRRRRGPSPRWGLLLAVVLLGGLLARYFAVSEGPSGPPDAPGPTGSGHPDLQKLLGDPEPRPSIDTAPAESALVPLRSKLTIPPRTFASEHLAFSGDRVARTVDSGIEIVQLATGANQPKRWTVAAPEVRALFEMGASLGAIVAGHVWLFDSGRDAPRRTPGVTMFPDSRVFPDLVTRAHLLVLHPGTRAIYRYELGDSAGALLPIVGNHQLPQFDGRVFVPLRDGSFVYSTATGFMRLYASGHTKKLVAPQSSVAPVRAFRAKRIDQIFVLYENGRVERFHLLDRMRSVWSTELGAVPFDIVAVSDDLALLEDVRGSERRWRVRVVSAKHEVSVLEELGASEVAGEAWAERFYERFALGVSQGRLAAVGPGGLRVWKLSTRERLVGPR